MIGVASCGHRPLQAGAHRPITEGSARVALLLTTCMTPGGSCSKSSSTLPL